ncbi:MAG: serine/threonine-protein kinase [Myxococcota bacterium]
MSAHDLPYAIIGDRYHLERLIGRGGMAAVYLAHDGRDRPWAIKVLSDKPTARARTRFLREARTTARLDHPNVVRVVDVGDDAPPFYIAMELAAGGSLAQRVRLRGRQSPQEALGWTLQILQGLHHAHRAGVVHRDIKPHNMLLTHDAGAAPWRDPGRLKLTDFGIAKWSGDGSALTGADDALGTMAYMAPEQRADPRRADARSDLYGVGATLYLLATRRRPVDLALVHRDPGVLDVLVEPIRSLVARAVQRDPLDRFGSAREMGEAVVECLTAFDPDVDVAAAMAGFD